MKLIITAFVSCIIGLAIGFYVAHNKEKGWKLDQYKIVDKSAEIIVRAHKERDSEMIQKIDEIISEFEGIDQGWKVCKKIYELDDSVR